MLGHLANIRCLIKTDWMNEYVGIELLGIYENTGIDLSDDFEVSSQILWHFHLFKR